MHHYTACGLDNAWLTNGYVEKSTAYGKAVAVVNVDQLHVLLGRDLVKKRAPLAGKELRFLRDRMGLSQAGFASLHGVTEQAVSLCERQCKIPLTNDRLTRVYYLAHFARDTPLGEAIEWLKTVKSLVRQKIVASISAHRGWSSKVTVMELLPRKVRSAKYNISRFGDLSIALQVFDAGRQAEP